MPAHEKINYVEYPARDLDATRRFFQDAFGWTFEDYGPDYIAFSGQGLDGGFYRSDLVARTGDGSALIVFYSDRLEDTQAKVLSAGGQVVKAIFPFPGGRRFHFTEPSGNEFAVWAQPASSQEGSMETQQLHRGRLIDHVQLVVRDLGASQKFYTAVLGVLGIPIGGTGEGYFWADELFVSTADSQAAQGVLTGRHHLAFQAADRAMVEAFHRSAMANGGKDNGAPGERPYHPGYYAAFVLDPDGNNIEAVYHGEAARSAPSVEITF